ncbi:MAG: hypothetical protein UX88_C0032G0003 [Candidatus Woesebacteria bacterium GW2011_GWC2_47_16]|uniref:Uncharacterized protein n=2 Tax=Candidatus Woeseibacteriota TaxID=1752722 RepID=A0A0G1TUN1_9BACT|nr:MAG: hypothetical protein UX67_C0005G0005 [Candidatus Woesebacteria bacterium GW2011_GWF2_46_8]KKU63336.1 MAG: hypothetical protein UX88_C0032G0003 [Candidatus Woesebacteria bacterium GW2011_GWC2_47_16]
MTTEFQRSTRIVIDPQEVNFHKKAQEWVHDEISHDELLRHYPSYLLSAPERIVRFVQEKVSQITRKAESVK